MTEVTTTPPARELVALLELSERATPGEWCAFLQGTTGPVVDDAIHAEPGQCCDGGGDIVCNEPGEENYPASQKYWEANAQFIAALVNWFRSTRAATVPRGVSVDAEYRLDVALEAYADIFDGMPGSHAKAMRHAIDAATTKAVMEYCRWTLDETEFSSIWETACGESWSFTTDGPIENGVRFCQGCGKPIEMTQPPAELGEES